MGGRECLPQKMAGEETEAKGQAVSIEEQGQQARSLCTAQLHAGFCWSRVRSLQGLVLPHLTERREAFPRQRFGIQSQSRLKGEGWIGSLGLADANWYI